MAPEAIYDLLPVCLLAPSFGTPQHTSCSNNTTLLVVPKIHDILFLAFILLHVPVSPWNECPIFVHLAKSFLSFKTQLYGTAAGSFFDFFTRRTKFFFLQLHLLSIPPTYIKRYRYLYRYIDICMCVYLSVCIYFFM